MVLLTLLSLIGWAQTGPAGVGNQDGTDGQPRNVLWLDASSLGLLNGASVPLWTDLSGNGNDATQSTLSQQPSFVQNGSGNITRPLVRFDNTGGNGNQDYLQFDGSYLEQSDYSVIVVGARRSTSGRDLWIGGLNSGANNNLHAGWDNNAIMAHQWGNDHRGNALANAPGSDQNSFGIFTHSLASNLPRGHRKITQNGQLLDAKDDTRQLNAGQYTAAFLARYIGSYYDIDIAEFLVYSDGFNGGQRTVIENYLSEKYGIAIANDFFGNATNYSSSYSQNLIGIGTEDGVGKHTIPASGSGALYLGEAFSSLDETNEFVFVAHDGTGHGRVTTGTDYPTSTDERWTRSWYVERTQGGTTDAGNTSVTLGFDYSDAGGLLTVGTVQNVEDYVLLYRASPADNFSYAPASVTITNTDRVTFTVDNANFRTGYYTLGRADVKTWYAYLPGDWDTGDASGNNIWTLDPSASLYDNTGNYTPSTSPTAEIDRVVIPSDKSVKVTGNNKANNSLEVRGEVDFTTTTGHTFGVVRGNGKILLAADNFPAGGGGEFATAGTGGTVEYYGGDINLDTDREFNHQIVNLTGSTNVLTLRSDYTLNGNLTVKQGTLRINDDVATDIRHLTVRGDVAVEAAASITTGAGNTAGTYSIPYANGIANNMPAVGEYHNIYHQFVIYGDFDNNGSVRFTNEAAPRYNQFSYRGAVTVRFQGETSNTVTLNGPTDFYNLVVDKGVDQTYQLTLNPSKVNYFKLFGPNNAGRVNNSPFTAANPEVRKALWIHHGTLILTGDVFIPTLSEGNRAGGNGDYPIGANAGLYLAGANVEVYSTANDNRETGNTQVDDASGETVATNSSNQALSIYGTFKITEGSFSTRNSAGLIFWAADNGTCRIEGGTVDVAQVRSAGSGGTASYFQSGGQVYVRGNTNVAGEVSGGYGIFNIEEPTAVFNMSGGEIFLRDTGGGDVNGLEIRCAEGNYNVTGGTIYVEVNGNVNFEISSTANLYNLVTRRLNVSNRTNVRLKKNVVVSNDLTIESNTRLRAFDENEAPESRMYHDVLIKGNLRIEDNAIYDFGQNTTTFQGRQDAQLYVGDITSVDRNDVDYADPENSNTFAAWEQPFYNLTVNKPGATLTLATKRTVTNPDNVFYEEINGLRHKNINGWRNNLVKVANNFALEAGTVDIDTFSIRLYGEVTNRGVLSIDASPTNALVKLRRVANSNITRVITTIDGSVFGNTRLNSEGDVIAFTSNVYIKRLEYHHGRINMGTYNLKVDDLRSALADNAQFDVNGNGTIANVDGNGNGDFNDPEDTREIKTFSPADMIITAGNASDGGLSLLVNRNMTLTFPVGIGDQATELNAMGAKYTPATVRIFNHSDDGYITINPVNSALTTTDQSGGDLLSYHWRVRYQGFTTLPNVRYNFTYDPTDVVGDESQYVAGKVLDTAPYTRSYEDDTVPEEEGVNATYNTITFDGPSDNKFSLENANYTAGQRGRFIGAPRVFYSRRSSNADDNTKWNDTSTSIWTFDGSNTGPYTAVGAADLPIAVGDIVVIRSGHQIFANSTQVFASELILDATNGASGLVFEDASEGDGSGGRQQDAAYTSQFGKVMGRADGPTAHVPFIEFYVDSDWNETVVDNNEFVLPSSDYGDFLNFVNSNDELADVKFTFDDSADRRGLAYLPDDITEFPNLRFKLATSYFDNVTDATPRHVVILPEADITVKGTLSLEDGAIVRLSDDNLGDVTTERIEYLEPGAIQFPGSSAAPRLLAVNGSISMLSNNPRQHISVVDPATGSLQHTLRVGGDILMQNGLFDLYGESATNTNVILELSGERSGTFTNASGTTPDLYRIVMDKGEKQDSVFTFSTDINLFGPTDGAPKAIELRNGTLVLNDAAIDVNLNTGNEPFLIPATAALDVRQGQANVSGDDTGILLDGLLSVSGGIVNVGTNGNSNNYIEYSASGNAAIEVTGGSLIVGAQIRRSLSNDDAVLSYTQTSGSVEVGRYQVPTNNRGVFEVVGSGSSFTHGGGDFTVVRQQGEVTVPSLLFLPETAVLAPGTTITLGSDDTPANQTITISADKPLRNLRIRGQNDPTVQVLVQDLRVEENLDIENSTVLSTTTPTTSFDLYVGGNFTNAGTYVPGDNTTVFDGTDQQIVGTTTFNRVSVRSSTSLTLNDAIRATHHVDINQGTLIDNGNIFDVEGNLYYANLVSHTSGAGGGIRMSGGAQQEITGNATGGVIGRLIIDNGTGVLIPDGNQFAINQQLVLNSGVLDIDGNLLTINRDATVDGTFSANRMIRTNLSFTDNGVRKVFPAGASTFTYPIGSGNKYTPVTVNATANGSSIGSMTIKPSNKIHPSALVNDSESPNPEIIDQDNVLQYYWVLRSESMTGFSGDMFMTYDQSDVAFDATYYTEADYIAGHLRTRNNPDGVWDESLLADNKVNETTNVIEFNFTAASDDALSGDYTAGIDDAIDDVKTYVADTDGAWTDAATWSPVPPEVSPGDFGPLGATIIINSGVTLTLNKSNTSSHQFQINGTLEVAESAVNNALGSVVGTGSMHVYRGDLPAGDYTDFFGCASAGGGNLIYDGSSTSANQGNYTLSASAYHVRNLTIRGVGNRRMPNQNFIICEDFALENNAHFINLHDKVITVRGNVAKSAASVFGASQGGSKNGKVVLDGAVLQTISGNFRGPSAFNILQLDNASHLTIQGDNNDVVFTKELLLTRGLIFTDENNVLVADENAIVTPATGSANAYVEGPMGKVRTSGAVNPFIFPVGKAGRLGNIAFSNPQGYTGSERWTAEYFNEDPANDGRPGSSHDGTVATVSALEYWSLEGYDNGAQHAAAFVHLRWDDESDVSTVASERQELRVMKWVTDQWVNQGGTNISGDASDGTLRTANKTTFSKQYFTLGSTTENNALPVELLSFTATAKDEAVLLHWETASELNNDFFEVLRSLDGINFEKIGEVGGAGTSYEVQSYRFADSQPVAGVSYYQLKQVDYNGMYDYSDKVSVEWTYADQVPTLVELHLYPNPAPRGEAKLKVTGLPARSAVTVRLLDMFGKVHWQKAVTSDQLAQGYLINLRQRLSVGIYVVSVQQGETVNQQTLIVR